MAEGIVDRDALGAVTHVRLRSLVRRWVQDYGYVTTNQDVGYWLAPRGLTQAIDTTDLVVGLTKHRGEPNAAAVTDEALGLVSLPASTA